MQLLVYAAAVNQIYGSKPEVGDWFLRSNDKVFFNPKTKPSTHSKQNSQI